MHYSVILFGSMLQIYTVTKEAEVSETIALPINMFTALEESQFLHVMMGV